jgi:hypothetical protein
MGVGLVLFAPTGLSLKSNLSFINSWDAAFGWDVDDFLYAHGSYLWHKRGIYREDFATLHLHYGLGGRALVLSDNNSGVDNDADDPHFGLRLPVGIDCTFDSNPLEFFAELALVMDVVPDTDAGFDVGIGGRYYF